MILWHDESFSLGRVYRPVCELPYTRTYRAKLTETAHSAAAEGGNRWSMQAGMTTGSCVSRVWSYPRRYAAGVSPKVRLNKLMNALALE